MSMSDSEDPDWTPEKEREEDPGKLQKEYLKIGKELLDSIKKDKAKAEAEAQAIAEQACELPGSAPGATIGVYKPPLLSKILDRYEVAWKAICARFEDPNIRVEIFRVLLHSPFRVSDDEEVV